MGCSQELSEFKGTVIGCHLYNKSIHEISLLLNIPHSTVSHIKSPSKMQSVGCSDFKACCHWTLEQWRCVLWSDESCFSVWQSEGRVWVWRLPEE
ncbi:unnamed protein product [Staurois parvus]|uniref:Uncharacterized protein n=1 Tax=Staurois parvus TaxID=386267 RepID=A0ABN9GFJ1_9NEOB|nr:unnamed protein product [Staurois parvus]